MTKPTGIFLSDEDYKASLRRHWEFHDAGLDDDGKHALRQFVSADSWDYDMCDEPYFNPYLYYRGDKDGFAMRWLCTHLHKLMQQMDLEIDTKEEIKSKTGRQGTQPRVTDWWSRYSLSEDQRGFTVLRNHRHEEYQQRHELHWWFTEVLGPIYRRKARDTTQHPHEVSSWRLKRDRLDDDQLDLVLRAFDKACPFDTKLQLQFRIRFLTDLILIFPHMESVVEQQQQQPLESEKKKTQLKVTKCHHRLVQAFTTALEHWYSLPKANMEAKRKDHAFVSLTLNQLYTWNNVLGARHGGYDFLPKVDANSFWVHYLQHEWLTCAANQQKRDPWPVRWLTMLFAKANEASRTFMQTKLELVAQYAYDVYFKGQYEDEKDRNGPGYQLIQLHELLTSITDDALCKLSDGLTAKLLSLAMRGSNYGSLVGHQILPPLLLRRSECLEPTPTVAKRVMRTILGCCDRSGEWEDGKIIENLFRFLRKSFPHVESKDAEIDIPLAEWGPAGQEPKLVVVVDRKTGKHSVPCSASSLRAYSQRFQTELKRRNGKRRKYMVVDDEQGSPALLDFIKAIRTQCHQLNRLSMEVLPSYMYLAHTYPNACLPLTAFIPHMLELLYKDCEQTFEPIARLAKQYELLPVLIECVQVYTDMHHLRVRVDGRYGRASEKLWPCRDGYFEDFI